MPAPTLPDRNDRRALLAEEITDADLALIAEAEVAAQDADLDAELAEVVSGEARPR